MRNWQFNQAEQLGLKNLPELNKQTQISRDLINSLGKQVTGKTGNDLLGLTDWIILAHGDPTAIAGFLTKKGFSNKAVQSGVAKLLAKSPSIAEKTAELAPTATNIERQVSPTGAKLLSAPKEGALKSQNLVPIQGNPTSSIEPQAQQVRRQIQLDKTPLLSAPKGQTFNIQNPDAIKLGQGTTFENPAQLIRRQPVIDQSTKLLSAPKSDSVLGYKNPGSIKIAPEGFKGDITSKLGSIPNKEGGFVAQSVPLKSEDALVQAAKKYKSAEDFVKAKTNAFHGSDTEIKQFDTKFLGKNTESKGAKDTFFFTSSKEMADEYGRGSFLKKKVGELGNITPEQRPQLLAEAKGKAKINEVSLDYKNPKIITKRGLLKDNQVAKDIQKAKEQGYDAIIYKDVIDPVLGDSEKFIRGDITAVFDSKNIKTKSQLTDIWNKAQQSKGSAKINPLLGIAGATAVGAYGASKLIASKQAKLLKRGK